MIPKTGAPGVLKSIFSINPNFDFAISNLNFATGKFDLYTPDQVFFILTESAKNHTCAEDHWYNMQGK